MTKREKGIRGRKGEHAAYGTAESPRRRLIALDVDGTIITHGGHLDARVHAAITACVSNGHHVVIATGRSVVATMPVLARLGIGHGYAVCSNGAVPLVSRPPSGNGPSAEPCACRSRPTSLPSRHTCENSTHRTSRRCPNHHHNKAG